MSNQISDAILESIDILVDGKIKDLKFDKTVQATIFEIVDVDKGEYRVRYKDNIFLAYSSDLETVYKTGTDIYLKIPEDDMSNKKIIEGKVKSSSQASADLGIYQEVIGPEWSYFYNELHSATFEMIAGYSKDKNIQYSSVSMNENQEILNYLKQYNKVKITADFMTTFESEFSSGNYGLIFLFSTKDNKVLSYTLDKENFVGNPYQYTSYSTQEAIIEFNPDYITGLIDIIPFENFDKYDEITIIDKDEQGNAQVITQDNKTESNIFIQNITMQFIDNIDLTQNLYYLSIGTPQGISITKEKNILLNARLLYKGEDITDKGKWFWFEEDLSVNIDSAEYNKSAGLGWRQIHNASGLNLTYENINTYEKRYKVIVYYGEAEITLTKEITVYDTTQETQYILYYGADLQGAYLEIQPELKENINWYRILPTGIIEVLNETSNRLYISSNYLQYPTETFKVQSNDIILQSTIKNTTSIEDLVVTFEGQELYSYDINGDITIEESEKERQLKCNLVWKEGLGAQYIIQWYIGDQEIKQNITIDEAANDNWISPEGSMIEKAWVDADNILHYQVRQKYSNNRDNNLIRIKITSVEEKVYTYEKGITFIKVGDQGTNGSTYVLIVRPIGYEAQRDGYYYINGQQEVIFEASIYCNGKKIDNSNIDFTWFGVNVDLNNVKDITNQDIKNQKKIKPNNSTDIIGNYITVSAKYIETENQQTKYLYTHYPINYTTSKIEKNQLSPLFKLPTYIKYNVAGLNPYYDKDNFNFILPKDASFVVTNNIITQENQENYQFIPQTEMPTNQNIEQIIITFNNGTQLYCNIVTYIDTYGNEAINAWDGKSVKLDDDKYIYTPQIGAGKKEILQTENGAVKEVFTGIIMGLESQLDQRQVGLYGYQKSVPTFGFKADGTGFIGIDGAIKFDGTTAIIEGNGGSGTMTLDLVAEKDTDKAIDIIYNEKSKFSVNYQGQLKAIEASITGEIHAESGSIGNLIIDNNSLQAGAHTVISDSGITTNFIAIDSGEATGTIGAGEGNDGNVSTDVLMFKSDDYSVVIETPQNIRLSADKNIYLNADEIYINGTTLENYIKQQIPSNDDDTIVS